MLGGCERVVSLDPDDATPILAIEAAFEPDSTLRLVVEQTVPIGAFGNGTPASVRAEITDGRGTSWPFEYRPAFVGNANYASEARVRPGEAYTLRVTADGLAPATAAFRVPRPAEEFSAVRRDATGRHGEVDVTVRFRDPPGEGDLYTLDVYSIRPDGGDSQLSFETLDPSIRDESFFDTIRSGAGSRAYTGPVFSDALFDGESHAIQLRVLAYDGGGPDSMSYVAELRVCSPAYADQRRRRRGEPLNPFSELSAPPSNVVGGIGSVGAFVRQRVVL